MIMQRIPSDILAPKIPGQRALLVVMLSLIALLMGAGIAAAIRFEQSAAQMYVANLHAVAKLGAIRLEDVFRGAQEMMGVATRCNLTHQASDDQLQEVLSEMYVALQSSGALSVAALQNGRLVEASGTQVKDAAGRRSLDGSKMPPSSYSRRATTAPQCRDGFASPMRQQSPKTT